MKMPQRITQLIFKSPLLTPIQKIRWKSRKFPEYEYSSFDDFRSVTEVPDGIHHIPLAENITIDMLALGDPLGREKTWRMPVFFNGSVGERKGTRPPYFSGKHIWRSINSGIIAFSDPIYEVSPTIQIGWYTGIPRWHLQERVAEVLTFLSQLSGKEILCIGGSGGGFAALEAATRIHCAAFVWNPQTAIMAYSGQAISAWLSVLFPGQWKNTPEAWRTVRQELLIPSGITYQLFEKPLPDSLLYMQNDADWHVGKHLIPYIKDRDFKEKDYGILTQGDSHTVLFLHFGEMHARPSRATLIESIRRMLLPDSSPYEVAQHIAKRFEHEAPSSTLLPESLFPSIAEESAGDC